MSPPPRSSLPFAGPGLRLCVPSTYREHFRKFDIEGDSPHPTLRELKVNFEPTYPYSEDPRVHDEFLTKRYVDLLVLWGETPEFLKEYRVCYLCLRFHDSLPCPWLLAIIPPLPLFSSLCLPFPHAPSPLLRPPPFQPARCPAWCDRVLMTEAALQLMEPADEHAYDIIGRRICMGDHKVGTGRAFCWRGEEERLGGKGGGMRVCVLACRFLFISSSCAVIGARVLP